MQPINTHMLFLGNPGTGKTEVARVVGRYLSAIGLRSHSGFVEISRTDIASQYNSGECISRMREALDRAAGGVLFVDEAYQFAEGEWMRGAIETLMKAMEDSRDSTTVILAGYEDKMQALWNINPGFRSRIPETHWYRFPDYTAAELEEIFRRMCTKRGLEPTAVSARARLFIDAELRRGRFGNARGVRNLVETVVQRRSELGGGELTPEMVPEPAGFRSDEVDRLMSSLEQTLIGATSLKDYLNTVALRAQTAEEFKRPVEGSIHCRFVGPPGTGKTTAARLVGRIFQAMGILSRGHLVEVDPIADFGSAYIGDYARRVAEQFERARGGVLFIDEAYRLADEALGTQILNQIVQTLTGPGFTDTVVIMAGYPDRMNALLQVNSGLASRIPKEVRFEPFSLEALTSLFHHELDEREYVVEWASRERFDQILKVLLDTRRSDPDFANARSLKEFVLEVLDRQARRTQRSATSRKFEVLIDDLGEPPSTPDDIGRLLEELETRFVGMRPVKEKIRLIAQRIRFQARSGGPRPKAPRLLFLGNPGTGKTTAAQELARVLRALGALTTDRAVITRGTELQAPYVGQSQACVLKAFRNARGGMLFIDEAYALACWEDQNGSFVREVVDAITGQTELAENAQTVIILAGYTDPMKAFLESNRGLASRFPERIVFPDYSGEECLEILSRWIALADAGERLPLEDQTLRRRLIEAFEQAKELDGFGNARDVETLGERILDARVLRSVDSSRGADTPPGRLTEVDVLHGLDQWIENKIG